MCKTETKTPPRPSTTPSGSQPGSGVTPPCHPTCTLASQTVATSPTNRARTTIGVGEEVTLTVTGNPATWAITSGGGTLSPNTGARNSVTFTADDNAASVTITATGSGCSCVNTITFTVVRPANWTMKRRTGTNLRHTHGRPGTGWRGIMYVHPNNVNFYRVEVREVDSQFVATGCISHFSGDYHGGYPPPDRVSSWISLNTHTDADGTQWTGVDNIDTGDYSVADAGAAPPFNVGTGYFSIVMQWHVIGGANIHDFAAVRQEEELSSTGRCESRKGGNTEFTMHDDPTSTP
jgi:hypothetical protein